MPRRRQNPARLHSLPCRPDEDSFFIAVTLSPDGVGPFRNSGTALHRCWREAGESRARHGQNRDIPRAYRNS
jgi:hypothetical protein